MTAVAFPKPARRVPKLKAGQHRRKYIRARRPRRLDGAGSDPARLSWIHTQPCLLLAFDSDHRCAGRIEACHEGPKPGVAMKCPDSETVPFCTDGHAQWQQHRGFFRGWPKAQRRDWMDARIAETTSRYLSAGNRRAR